MERSLKLWTIDTPGSSEIKSVTVDGKVIRRCVWADEIGGVLEYCVEDAEGNLQLSEDQSEILTAKAYGEVRVHF